MKKNVLALLSPFLLFSMTFPVLAADTKTQNTNLNQQLESQSTLPQIIKAAEEGDPDAQYALGYLYYYGRGVQQDMNLAKQWIKKAANQGQQQAVQAEKILLGTTPSIQPKVNPILQPNGNPPDKPHTLLPNRDEVTKEPVVTNDEKAVSEIIQEEKPTLEQKDITEANNVANPEAPVKVENKLKNKISSTPATHTKPAAVKTDKKEHITPKKKDKKATSQKQKLHPTEAKHPSHPTLKEVNKERTTKIKGNYFTIQLLSSSKKQDVVRFIGKAPLKANYYQTYRDGQKWYVVTYGNYPTRKSASSAINKLPESIKKNHPWVKSSQMVNKEMSKGKGL